MAISNKKGVFLMVKKCLAEFIGTAVLVTFGCGVAMTNGFGTGFVGTALAFGLVIVAMAYSIGNISGCHVNPAVSIAMLVNGKMTLNDFVYYVVSQFLGALAGACVLLAIFGSKVSELGMGTNGFNEASAVGISMGGAFVAEVVLTFVFVIAICGVTSREKFSNVSGIVIGLALTLVHLMGLPLTGTSVNPARSFGPALVSVLADGKGGDLAIGQVWLFIVAPLIGGAIAAIVYKALDSSEE
jgi:transporter MIP family